jgi:acyl-CoA synthetase (AMP-forming)/AMP-acid ligase II
MSVRHSLGSAVEKQLRCAPDQIFMRYLHRGEVETAALTGAELDTQARRVAAGLLARGLGEARLILAFETGPAFLHALLGCLYAGAVAIPAPKPRPGIAAERLESIAAASGAAAILTSEALQPRLGGARAKALPIVTIEALAAGEPATICPGLEADPAAPAIIQ